MYVFAAIAAYSAVALFAIYMTWREHQRDSHRSLALNGLSYLLCLIWPLTALAMFIFAKWRAAEFAPADQG